ncbi:MAG: MFS transporter [Chloroflexi bacterium]|nr:MFS transporter [Chloroflexota bacterium]
MKPQSPSLSKWTILITASLGAFLMPVDSSMLFLVVPQIATALKQDPALVTWVPTASLIGTTAFSIPLGRLSDVLGRKRLYLAGLLAAGVTALLAGFAQNAYQLIALRLFSGAGAALIAANAWALISDTFPSQERGKALGINTAVSFLGLSTGPVIGGSLVTFTGTWRSIFFFAFPLYMALMVLSYWWIPRDSSAVGGKRPADLPGSLSFIVGLGLLMLALSFGRLSGWASLPTLSFFASSAAFLALFGYVELRLARSPMLDLRVFSSNSQFALGNLATVFHYMSAHQGLTVLIAFYVQWVLNRSAAIAGVITLAKFLTMAIFSPFSGWLSDRIGPRWLCALGMAFVTASLLLLAAMGPEASLTNLFLRLSLLGVGIGLFASPNINSVLSSLPKDKLGTASGTLGMFRSLGGTLGLVLVGSIVAGGKAEAGFAVQIKTALIALAVAALAGAVVSAIRGKSTAEPTG